MVCYSGRLALMPDHKEVSSASWLWLIISEPRNWLLPPSVKVVLVQVWVS